MAEAMDLARQPVETSALGASTEPSVPNNEEVRHWIAKKLRKSAETLTERTALLPLPLKAFAVHRTKSSGMSSVTISMQGWRSSMEDDACGCVKLEKHPTMVYAGVFDGHAGPKASRWFSKRLHTYLDKMKNFTAAEFVEACVTADSDFLRTNTAHDDGTTAVFLILEEKKNNPTNSEKKYQLTVGNIGDSRCLLIANESTVQQLTEDHLPCLDHELKRIVKAGGFVSSGRVDGALAVSRAFGDFAFKDNMMLPLTCQRVVSTPDVVRVDNVGGSDLVLLCCDGIFECLSSQQVASFILERSAQVADKAQVLCDLMDLSLALGSQDNMTAMLISFDDIQTHEIAPQASGSASEAASQRECHQKTNDGEDEEEDEETANTKSGEVGGEAKKDGEAAYQENEMRFGQMAPDAVMKLSPKDRLDFLTAYVVFARRHCGIGCELEALQQFAKAYKLDLCTILESICSNKQKTAPIW